MECKVNIYVSNISYQTTEDHLRQAFARFGSVTAVSLITDRDSSRPKGLAFVDMPAESEAVAAIKGLNGQRLNGRSLKVCEANQLEANGNSLAGNRSRKVY